MWQIEWHHFSKKETEGEASSNLLLQYYYFIFIISFLLYSSFFPLSLFLFLLFRAIRDILPVIIINKIISLIITPNLRRLNSGKRNVIVISTGIRTHARACIRQSTEYCDFFLFSPIFFRRRFSSSVL